MPKILLVEDEGSVASFIRRGLKEEGYIVDSAEDGEEGLRLALESGYDLLVLDWSLPKKNGLEVLTALRDQKNPIPVLMLTAKSEVEDKVKSLNAGADDYLTKPFAFKEFLARVSALLRRPQKFQQTLIEMADLRIDLAKQKAVRAGKEIQLSAREFALLIYLAQHPHEVVTRTMLAESLWDLHFDTFSNLIDVQIGRLRKKIDLKFKKKLIHTVRGKGYIFSDAHD